MGIFLKTTIHEKMGCYIPITYFYENKIYLVFVRGKKKSQFICDSKSNKCVCLLISRPRVFSQHFDLQTLADVCRMMGFRACIMTYIKSKKKSHA